MYVTKEKNRYSECFKKVLYAGPKSPRNILTNLSPNPSRSKKPRPTYNSGPAKPCKGRKTHSRLSCVLSNTHTFALTQMRRCV